MPCTREDPSDDGCPSRSYEPLLPDDYGDDDIISASEIRAYDEGAEAFHDDVPSRDNPYLIDSDEWFAWDDGWSDAQMGQYGFDLESDLD